MINWNQRWKGTTVGEMWTGLTEILTNLVTVHVPLKKELRGREEKDYPSRYRRRLEKEVKHGKSTVNTVQEETLTGTNG